MLGFTEPTQGVSHREHASRRTVLTITGKYHTDRGGDLLRRSQLLNIVAGQHVYWQEQSRHAWKELSTASFERAAQEYDLAACNEVDVASTQATEMSTAETVQINLSFGFSRAVGRASDSFTSRLTLSPGNLFFSEKCQKTPTNIAKFLYIPVRKHLFGACQRSP